MKRKSRRRLRVNEIRSIQRKKHASDSNINQKETQTQRETRTQHEQQASSKANKSQEFNTKASHRALGLFLGI